MVLHNSVLFLDRTPSWNQSLKLHELQLLVEEWSLPVRSKTFQKNFWSDQLPTLKFWLSMLVVGIVTVKSNACGSGWRFFNAVRFSLWVLDQRICPYRSAGGVYTKTWWNTRRCERATNECSSYLANMQTKTLSFPYAENQSKVRQGGEWQFVAMRLLSLYDCFAIPTFILSWPWGEGLYQGFALHLCQE